MCRICTEPGAVGADADDDDEDDEDDEVEAEADADDVVAKASLAAAAAAKVAAAARSDSDSLISTARRQICSARRASPERAATWKKAHRKYTKRNIEILKI